MANHEAAAASAAPQFGQPNVRLEVQDFRPLAQASIELRPLTVFVGPSNTGKTYLALLIYALHYILQAFPDCSCPHTGTWILTYRRIIGNRERLQGRHLRKCLKDLSRENKLNSRSCLRLCIKN